MKSNMDNKELKSTHQMLDCLARGEMPVIDDGMRRTVIDDAMYYDEGISCGELDKLSNEELVSRWKEACYDYANGII